MLLDDVRFFVLDTREAVGDVKAVADLVRPCLREVEHRSSRDTTSRSMRPPRRRRFAPVARAGSALGTGRPPRSRQQSPPRPVQRSRRRAARRARSAHRHARWLGGSLSNCQTDTCLRLSLVNGSRLPAAPSARAAASRRAAPSGRARPATRSGTASRRSSTRPVDDSRSGARRGPGSRRRTRRSPSASRSTWKTRIGLARRQPPQLRHADLDHEARRRARGARRRCGSRRPARPAWSGSRSC